MWPIEGDISDRIDTKNYFNLTIKFFVHYLLEANFLTVVFAATGRAYK